MKNEPAFPLKKDGPGGYEEKWYGLTKREYFAAMVMQGLLDKVDIERFIERDVGHVARTAVYTADALIAELEKGSGDD